MHHKLGANTTKEGEAMLVWCRADVCAPQQIKHRHVCSFPLSSSTQSRQAGCDVQGCFATVPHAPPQKLRSIGPLTKALHEPLERGWLSQHTRRCQWLHLGSPALSLALSILVKQCVVFLITKIVLSGPTRVMSDVNLEAEYK